MTGAALAQATVYFGPSVGGATACSGLLGCTLAVLLDAAVPWLAVTVVPVLWITFGYLRTAREAVHDEVELTTRERDAFRAFGDRVADLDPDPGSAPSTRVAGYGDPGGGVADRIVEAYRETVLDLDHHERVYGESAEQNIRAELGEDVASVVLGEGPVGTPAKQLVVARAGQAAHVREQFLETLREELDQIDAAERELTDLADDLDAVDRGEAADPDALDDWHALERIEDRCEALARRRQDRIHATPGNRRLRGRTTLQEYLYSSLSVTYPVLASVTELLDAVQHERGSVLGAMAG